MVLDIEAITQKANHPRSFSTFVQMLKSAFEATTNRVALTLLTDDDLARLYKQVLLCSGISL